MEQDSRGFAAIGEVHLAPVRPVESVTLTLSLEQYKALRAEILGHGPMEGAWEAFKDIDQALSGR